MSSLVISCENKDKTNDNSNQKPIENSSLEHFRVTKLGVDYKESTSTKLHKLESIINDIPVSSIFDSKKVDLQMELTDLFSPNNFTCIDGDLKKKIQKLKRKSADNKTEVVGFIPDEVKNTIKQSEAYLLTYGASTLLHSFTYIDNKTKTESKILTTTESPTYKSFNLSDFNDVGDQNLPYMFYTLDCAGYFAAAIKAAGGAGGNEVSSEVKTISDKKKSLMIAITKLNTPLYLAYNGEGIFADVEDKDEPVLIEKLRRQIAIYKTRIAVLKSVIGKLKGGNEDISIVVKANYYVVVTTNSGESSFNGSGNINASGGGNFGFGSVSGSTEGKSQVSRTSEFKNYKTYVLDTDFGTETFPIPLKDYKNNISLFEKITEELSAKLKEEIKKI